MKIRARCGRHHKLSESNGWDRNPWECRQSTVVAVTVRWRATIWRCNCSAKFSFLGYMEVRWRYWYPDECSTCCGTYICSRQLRRCRAGGCISLSRPVRTRETSFVGTFVCKSEVASSIMRSGHLRTRLTQKSIYHLCWNIHNLFAVLTLN